MFDRLASQDAYIAPGVSTSVVQVAQVVAREFGKQTEWM